MTTLPINEKADFSIKNMGFSERKTYYQNVYHLLSDLPIFLQPRWLNQVAKTNLEWQVCLSHDANGNINGVLIYYEAKLKNIFSAIVMPELTPFVGIWTPPPVSHPVNGLKIQQRQTTERQIVENLLAQIPQNHFAFQVLHFSPNLRDWLPFHWAGYRQTTHYTYVLPQISDLEKTYLNLKGSVRTDLKKAKNTIEIRPIDDTNILYDLFENCQRARNAKPRYARETLKNLYDLLIQTQECTLLAAFDAQNVAHAAVFVVYDGDTAHYLAGGSHPDLRRSAAMNAVIWAAIEAAYDKGMTQFDFQGSMIPSVERVFRAFGGEQIPFFRMTKAKNRFYDFLTLFWEDYR